MNVWILTVVNDSLDIDHLSVTFEMPSESQVADALRTHGITEDIDEMVDILRSAEAECHGQINGRLMCYALFEQTAK